MNLAKDEKFYSQSQLTLPRIANDLGNRLELLPSVLQKALNQRCCVYILVLLNCTKRYMSRDMTKPKPKK